MVIGRRTPARPQTSVDQPATALTTTPASTRPRFVCTAVTRPFACSIPVTSVYGWISTPARSAPRARPQTTASWRMIPPGRVVERALDRPGRLVGEVELRAERRDLLGEDDARVDPEQLVDLGALLHRVHRAVGVGEREVAALREHQVEVELGREPLVELHARAVERGALGRAVVRADDRRVAAGGARADVRLLEHGDVRDAVVLGEVVGGREPVRAAADDHDVVALLQLAARPPHPARRGRCPSPRQPLRHVERDLGRRSGRAPAGRRGGSARLRAARSPPACRARSSRRPAASRGRAR